MALIQTIDDTSKLLSEIDIGLLIATSQTLNYKCIIIMYKRKMKRKCFLLLKLFRKYNYFNYLQDNIRKTVVCTDHLQCSVRSVFSILSSLCMQIQVRCSMYIGNPLQSGQSPQTNSDHSRAIKPTYYRQSVVDLHRGGRCWNVWAKRDAPVWTGSAYRAFRNTTKDAHQLSTFLCVAQCYAPVCVCVCVYCAVGLRRLTHRSLFSVRNDNNLEPLEQEVFDPDHPVTTIMTAVAVAAAMTTSTSGERRTAGCLFGASLDDTRRLSRTLGIHLIF
ncbi:hypothetical protein AGLY_003067 [Aphis glycines]|uniref:Uncharacterized protein n=1 Tax=Aphis glycines TaxID=307491 RepID=A0A6G0U4K7_APHGL|nr:hypothetical protein AGLY_003067 [Aphis glycines]